MKGPSIRMASALERSLILAAALPSSGMETVEELPDCEVYVRENFVSDGPGYSGAVGIVHWSGAPGFLTAFVKRGEEWQSEVA